MPWIPDSRSRARARARVYMLGVASSRGKGAPPTQIDRVMSSGFSLR
eukprot:COSAG06_NODE_28654_length_570_cov_0.987261_1_plen_46_part_10